jgi:hypothetical protein
VTHRAQHPPRPRIRRAAWLLGLALAVAARTQEPAAAPELGELVANGRFSEAARGWTLVNAHAVPDLGPDDGPAVELAAAAGDAWSSVGTSMPAMVRGRQLTLSAQVEGLDRKQVVWLQAFAWSLDDSGSRWVRAGHWSQRVRPALGQWTRGELSFEVPASAAVLDVRVSAQGERPVLVADVNLRDQAAEPPECPAEQASGLSQDEADELARRAGEIATALREVRLWQAPSLLVVSRAAMNSAAAGAPCLLDRQRMANEDAALRLLGLYHGKDVLGSEAATLAGGPTALYLREPNVILVAADAPRDWLDLVIVHESVHAIDQQRFGCQDCELRSSGHWSGDGQLALRTVIEGSAVLAQLPYAQARPCAAANCLDLLSRDMASSIAEAGGENLMLRRSLAPYLLGVRFLTRGAGLDGSGRLPLVDLDHVALDPPRSTEQILHPAKYWDSALRDDPRELQVPDVSPQLGAGWSLASSDTLGELQLAALVGLALPQAPRSWTSLRPAGSLPRPRAGTATCGNSTGVATRPWSCWSACGIRRRTRSSSRRPCRRAGTGPCAWTTRPWRSWRMGVPRRVDRDRRT